MLHVRIACFKDGLELGLMSERYALNAAVLL